MKRSIKLMNVQPRWSGKTEITETTNLWNERRDTITDPTDTEEIECSSLIHPKWMSKSNKSVNTFSLYMHFYDKA